MLNLSCGGGHLVFLVETKKKLCKGPSNGNFYSLGSTEILRKMLICPVIKLCSVMLAILDF